jgi:hypothetical protein
MNTKTAKPEPPHVAALRRIITRPREAGIVGASAYWLGDIRGEPLGPESDRTIAPCAQALTMIQAGANAEILVVWARLADGRAYRVSGGTFLVDMAEAAAGLPARPRTLTPR